MKSKTGNRKLSWSIFLLLGVLKTFSQVPTNDNCSNAINLGTLPTPGVCMSGLQDGAPITIGSLTNVNATPSNPYTYLINCEGSASNMGNPALDVWYTFTATGNIVNIAITGFPNVNMGIWEGSSCSSLIGRGCSVDGSMSLFQTVIGRTYYIQLSGNNLTSTSANFSITLDNDIDCSRCLTQSSLTYNPAPTNGSYFPGQAVTFCYTIQNFATVNTNWLHGIQITYGSGWSGISAQTPATACSSSGTWNWYNSCTSSATNVVFGQGFYFESSTTDTNPGNNFGDGGLSCATGSTWTFCWTLTVSPSFNPGSDLSLTINTSGDGESGSWSNIGCAADPTVFFNAIGSCGISAGPDKIICTNQNASLNVLGGTNYSWTSISGDPIVVGSNFSCDTCANVIAQPSITTTYVVQTSNASFCMNKDTITVVVAPDFIVTSNPVVDSICASQPLSINTNISIPGTYSFSWSPNLYLSNPNIQNPIANIPVPGISSYTLSVTNSAGCVKKDTIAISVLTKPTAIINSLKDTVCLKTDLQLIASANPASTYSYQWYPSTNITTTNSAYANFNSQINGLNYINAITTNSLGCSDTASKLIFVEVCEIKIYSGFTPNNDNHNDLWIIDFIDLYPDNEVTILNKWGQIVWDIKGYNNNDKVWAGKNKNGDLLPDATYFYIISAEGKITKGRVELIR